MKENSRLTPINRLRERLVQLANDTQWGERLARWVGKAAGGLQLRWKVSTPGAPAWTPLKRPIAEATIALVTTGGVHLCSDTPFNLSTDASFRAIPRAAQAADLCLTHEHYDRRDAARDMNLVFPLERLRELEAAGIIGRVAGVHYGFGFTRNPEELLAPAREVGHRLARAQVDLALLVPA
jgi:D-proline reductase (dithiol) PrdB